ncbi:MULTISPECIES: AI-2E family transporter [Paraburkholderia]|uniref:Predicted PurR-regulated permease PerM n=1 Tax=Paraburkholderia phenazinium TaxID=60549 RepID=A0A1N6GQ87_9BURK|nr:AI-2E family transporter [Paraburkholderia phenazinium]SIO09664.1 Predicted PurR-regulated permease PerM [Paraburkholderia phenazinium]
MRDFDDPRLTRTATRIAPSTALGIEGLITLAVGVLAVAALYFARDVLIPITLAILLSFLVAPLANALLRIRLGHVASVFAAVLLSVSVIVLLASVIGTQLTDLVANGPHYEATIERKLDTAHNLTIGKLDRLMGTAGQALQRVTEPQQQPSPAPPPASRSAVAPSSDAQAPAAMPVVVREPVPTPFELARRFLTPAISPLETAFIVFVVTIVILLQRDDLRDRAIRLFGSRDLHRTTTVMDEAARRLSRYFVSQLGVNAGVGVVIGIGLSLIGVPSPILWGIMAALLRLVPYVGIWISAVLATALAAAVSPGWSMAIWSLALFVSVEVLVGQVVEPLLYGHSTGLSPFSVVVAAIFWSWIWGPIGLILSTPLTLCLLVLGRHVRRLEFLDVLLGDQPALTPIENFYQRALAGDPDEALAQAESLLRERSLCAYYDEVALKGLQLAANDVQRGSVTAAQLARIESTTNDLAEGLDSFPDRDPRLDQPEENWAAVGPSDERSRLPVDEASLEREARAQAAASEGEAGMGAGQGTAGNTSDETRIQRERAERNRAGHQVLCIAGRGPLDQLATSLLLQLLGKHDLNCRSLPHEAASRTAIDTLDTSAVTIVCLFYLNIDGIPSHLRYLVRRVRQRLPDASIVVGLWPQGQPEKWSDDLQSAIGADCYATSMQDMLNACCRIAATVPVEMEPAQTVDDIAA